MTSINHFPNWILSRFNWIFKFRKCEWEEWMSRFSTWTSVFENDWRNYLFLQIQFFYTFVISFNCFRGKYFFPFCSLTKFIIWLFWVDYVKRDFLLIVVFCLKIATLKWFFDWFSLAILRNVESWHLTIARFLLDFLSCKRKFCKVFEMEIFNWICVVLQC